MLLDSFLEPYPKETLKQIKSFLQNHPYSLVQHDKLHAKKAHGTLLSPRTPAGSFSLDLRSGHRIGVCRGGPRPRGVIFFFGGAKNREWLDDGVIKVYMSMEKLSVFE